MHEPSAWQPHEGTLLQMRADTRFGADGLPDGWWFGRVSAVVTDSDGLAYVAHRGPAGDPIVVLDAAGRYVRSWGRGRIGSAHGLRLAPDGALWLTDVGRHEVTRWERDGTLTLSLGTSGVAGTDDQCFDMPTDVAFAPSGDVYVSDGYGNSRIVRFRADGRRMGSFGTLIGHLLLRTWQRAERVHIAMLSRGFDGTFHSGRQSAFGWREFCFVIGWTVVIILLRTFDLTQIIGSLATGRLS